MTAEVTDEVETRVEDFLEALSALSMKTGVYVMADRGAVLSVEDADGKALGYMELPNLDFYRDGYRGSLPGAYTQAFHKAVES